MKLSKKVILIFITMILITNITACSSESEIEDKKIKDTIASMSVEEKLAQMMVVALRSGADNAKAPTEISEDYANIITKYDFGGIILFAGNLTDVEQTIKFIRDAQTAAIASKHAIPMLICADQEGGMVNRVPFGITGPGNMGLQAIGDISNVKECATVLGQEMAALGFNMDFAPVADVNNNPNNPVIGARSFSDVPNVVADNVVAFLQGLNENNISAALKHFPGHGNVDQDSHTGLPLSELTVDELKECELIPFKEGIKEGADMIMTAHIQFPNIETQTYKSKADGKDVYLPATLSHTIMNDILREELGFDGIIITDAMGMDAIASHFDPVDAAVLAINAGVDILLCPVDIYKDDELDTFSKIDKYIQDLVAKVEAGEIKEEELDDSVARILKLKYAKGIMSDTLADSYEDQLAKAKEVVGTKENLQTDWQMTQKAMTLLKNTNQTLPLDGNDDKHTLVLATSEYRVPTIEYAKNRLQEEGLLNPDNVSVVVYNELTFDDENLQKELSKADRLIVLSQVVTKNDLVTQAIDYMHKKDCQAILLSISLPYDAATYEDADAIVCTYNPFGNAHDENGNGPFNMNVAVGLCSIFNQSTPEGKLPVEIPMMEFSEDGTAKSLDDILYDREFGLDNWGNE